MENFIKHFRREPDGSRVCISFVELSTTAGRIRATLRAYRDKGIVSRKGDTRVTSIHYDKINEA